MTIRLVHASLCALLMSACTAFADAAAYQVDSLSPVAEDVFYRSALYHKTIGEFEKADALLAAAPNSSAVVNAHRTMLAGSINIHLHRYAIAEQLLTSITDVQVIANYPDTVIYPLARTYFAQNNCPKTLETLQRSTVYAEATNAHIMFLRVSCELSQGRDASVISQAEGIVNDALSLGDKKGRIWFAYAFYNIAVAAASQFQLYTEADRFLNQALPYVGTSKEGKQLAERIQIEIGYVNYFDNRFDYALDSFSKVPVNGAWADVSLLAYGWAAISAYKPDMAIEAWRQLIQLPYKSMSVYEGYMAIPTAYEKAGAFSDALNAYDDAIAQFSKMVVVLDAELKSFNAERAYQYARYFAETKTSEKQTPPAVIARLYTEDRLRGMVEEINQLDAYQSRLLSVQSALPGNAAIKNQIASLLQSVQKRRMALQETLYKQTVAILTEQKTMLVQYSLQARVTNARLQEEFFQRGGRRLWR